MHLSHTAAKSTVLSSVDNKDISVKPKGVSVFQSCGLNTMRTSISHIAVW